MYIYIYIYICITPPKQESAGTDSWMSRLLLCDLGALRQVQN